MAYIVKIRAALMVRVQSDTTISQVWIDDEEFEAVEVFHCADEGPEADNFVPVTTTQEEAEEHAATAIVMEQPWPQIDPTFPQFTSK